MRNWKIQKDTIEVKHKTCTGFCHQYFQEIPRIIFRLESPPNMTSVKIGNVGM